MKLYILSNDTKAPIEGALRTTYRSYYEIQDAAQYSDEAINYYKKNRRAKIVNGNIRFPASTKAWYIELASLEEFEAIIDKHNLSIAKESGSYVARFTDDMIRHARGD